MLTVDVCPAGNGFLVHLHSGRASGRRPRARQGAKGIAVSNLSRNFATACLQLAGVFKGLEVFTFDMYNEQVRVRQFAVLTRYASRRFPTH